MVVADPRAGGARSLGLGPRSSKAGASGEADLVVGAGERRTRWGEAVDWPRWRLGGAAQRRQQRQPRLRAAATLARNVKAVALVRRSCSAAEAAANLVARAGGEWRRWKPAPR